MAGLYDRIATSQDKIHCHYLVGSLKAYATGLWSSSTIINSINSLLQSPLTTEELADLSSISAEVDSLPDATAKLVYGAKIEAAIIAAEAGLVNDAEWRDALNIT